MHRRRVSLDTTTERLETLMADDLAAFGQHAWLIEEKHQRFLADPESVGPDWREFFEDYERKTARAPEPSEQAPRPDGELVPLRGADGIIARRMEESLGVPTATSVRSVPA